MRHTDIQAGDLLRLKPERQAVYGMASPLVRVSRVQAPTGYRTPWVYSHDGFNLDGSPWAFRPSDFVGAVELSAITEES